MIVLPEVRNTEMWWKGDSETRYKYLYSPEEISELAGRVKLAAGQTKLLFAFFNNRWQGYAPRNAVDMIRTLELPFEELNMETPLRDEGTSKE